MSHRLSTAGHPSNPLPTFDALEPRTLMTGTAASTLRSYDGSGNNLANTAWGATGAQLIRLAAAAYADGIGAPAGSSRPSARAISNAVADNPEGTSTPSALNLSAFSYLWGQFIDHDLDLTMSASPTELLNVAVPSGDAEFDPLGTGTQVIPLARSKYAAGTGVTTARQQVNDITSYLDGSMIYGSDATRAAALRTFAGGLMKTSDGGLLPFNTAGLSNANDAHIFAAASFLAGDIRANENSELTAVQTLFVREHNRLATKIAAQHADWTDEQIYQQARRLVIGEVQAITYNEYLPALLGPNALGRYTGYDPTVNAGISNEFSTAAFRLGHSMLTDDVEFLTNDGEDAQPDMTLAQVFFNPTVIERSGIDSIVKYLASSNSEEIDTKIVDSVRNFLFGAPGSGGLDLASLNIQRGRDHGIADYNTTRAALGLPKVTSFGQITSDTTLAGKLQQLYGSVDNIDLWVGGLAEDHVRGSNVGATFQRILVDQFTRTRSGDRFWYERDLTGNDLAMVRGTTLASVIAANTTTTNLQPNVFFYDTTISGRAWNDGNGNGRVDAPVEQGFGGLTLSLIDEDGVTAATTQTRPDGSYLFNNVQIGDYTVVPTLANRLALTTPGTPSINVTRAQAFNGVSFGIRPVQPPVLLPPPGPQPAPAPRRNVARDLFA